jgi:HK97 family phage prohead protease
VTIEYRAFSSGVGAEGNKLRGLVTPFNVETVIGDLNRGGFHEQIAPGAFRKTLQDQDVVLLFNHDTSKPLARISAGNLSLSETASGLEAEATPVNTSYGQDLLKLTRAKVVKGMSFGFEVIRDSWTDDQGRSSNPNVGTNRTIQEVRLHEVSAVTFPAYESTSLSA